MSTKDLVFSFDIVKISGNPTNEVWSGVFTEKPAELEKLELRGQLFLVISLAGHTAQELAHNFWEFFSKNYYSNLSGSVFTALIEAAKASQENFLSRINFVESGFITASIWGKILYLAGIGNCGVGLVRAGKFLPILQPNLEKPDQILSASGFLENGDLVFLTAQNFLTDLGETSQFATQTPAEIEEELGTKIGTLKQPERIAVCAVKVKEEIGKTEDIVTFLEPKPRLAASNVILSQSVFSKFWVKIVTRGSLILNRLIRLKNTYWPKKDIYLRTGSHRFLAKKLIALVLVGLVLALIISLSFGIWQRQRKINFSKFEQLYNQAQTLFEEAVEISSINRLRSRELLSEAQENLDQAKKFKFKKTELAALQEKITAETQKSLKLVKIENPNLIFDLNLVKSQTSIYEIEMLENLLAFDNLNPTLFTVDPRAKISQITSGGEGMQGFSNFTFSADFAYFLKPGDGIFQLNLKTGGDLRKVVNSTPQWGEILDLASFAGNLYLLDGKSSQIWKYTLTESGFSEIRPFILRSDSKINFINSSFAIDGFIWVTVADGKIYQVTPTETKIVEISGLDKPLSAKTILRTDELLENLYIGDLGNSRILVIGKNGLYLAQYTSGVFGNLADFRVNEKEDKVYFAQGSKIFQFDLAK